MEANRRGLPMSFDDPIYLDRTSLELLMDDTDQHRICWMYHDILSDPKIAWMFDRYAGKGTPFREAWTTMAWVAAAQQVFHQAPAERAAGCAFSFFHGFLLPSLCFSGIFCGPAGQFIP